VEHVRADLVPEPDVGLALRDGGHPLLLLALLQLVETRLQDLHRHRLVLVLRALVLTGDDDAGGQMGESDGRVGLVHVLAAGTARAIRVDAQVLVADADLDVLLDVGHHEHRRERRLTACVGVERRDAHQAVHAGLRLRVAVGVRSLQADRRALDAGALPRLLLEQLGLEPAALRPAQVNLDDGVTGIVLAAEELLQLERIEALRDGVDRGTQLPQRLGVALLRQLEIHLRLVDAFALLAPAGDRGLDAGVLARHGLGALGIVPQVGRRRLLAQLRRAFLEGREVKDASRARRPARRARGPARATRRAPW
jgi:hypothetical protein